MLGYAPGDLDEDLSQWIRLIHPDDLPAVMNSVTDHVEGRIPSFSAEYRILQKSGEWKWVLSRSKVLTYDEDGSPLKASGMIIDIDDRKRAEEALRESEEKFRLISEQSLLGIAILQDDVFKYVNKAIGEIFEYPLEEILSWAPKESMKLFAPEYRKFVAEQGRKKQVGDEDATANYQFVSLTKSGKRKWVEVYSRTVPFQGKNANLITLIDIDDRKRAEEALRESEEKFRMISEHSFLGIAIIQDDVYKYLNEALSNITEYSIEEMLGWAPGEYVKLVAPEDRDFVMEQSKKKQAGEEDVVSNYMWRAISKSGKRKWLELFSGTVLFQGRTANLITMFDVSDRKAAEEDLKRYRDHLEELVQERTKQLEEAQADLLRNERLATLGRLTATVSHEIRNPLGTVRTAVFSIGDSIEQNKPDRVERALKLAERNILRCDGIIEELLDFTRVRKLVLKPTPIDTWIADILKEQAIPESIKVSLDLNSNVELDIDRDRLRRAIVNVTHNAVQALQEDQSPGDELTVAALTDVGRLEIRVIDTGPGIPDDIIEKIFEPLFSTKGFGVGLGLASVRNIMEQHQGGVEINTKADRGTTVLLWLPIPD
jgi:PAS domain S-box-containing protein